MSQNTKQQTLGAAHQKEQEAQRLRNHTDAQLEQLEEQWKQQVSQAATCKAEIHALRIELQNVEEKSEVMATLSAKMISMDASRPVVEAEPDVFLKARAPRSRWILRARR